MDFEKQLAAGVERLTRARQSGQVVRIFCHIDADGLSSGAIISKALLRNRTPFQVRTLRQLEPKFIEDIARKYHTSPYLIIFTDFGSGQINSIARILPPEDIIICDHHEVQPDAVQDFPYHYNPALFGHDGARDVSGAGMSYFLARSMDARNKDLASIAVVGAIGDRQDIGERHALIGLNDNIVSDGIAVGTIDVIQGIRIFGRETRPIANAISMSTEPYLKGLTGNTGACEALLTNLGIKIFDTNKNRMRVLADLTLEETQTLISGLVNYCVMNLNLDPELVLDLIGTIYRFPKEPEGKSLHDAQEFSNMLNACGRTGHSDLGIAICLGDRRESLQEAEKVLTEYKQKLREVLEAIEQGHSIKSVGSIYLLDVGDAIDEKMLGGVCSVALVNLPPQSPNPLIGIVVSDEGTLKISGRASISATKAGLDLGKAMHSVASELKVEYPAGGHPGAAGAKIPSSLKEAFINMLEKKVEEMIAPR